MIKIVIIRTIVLLTIAVLAYRLMGKKEISQLNIIDLLITILVAELVAILISDPDKSIFIAIIPIIILTSFQLLLSYISIKNNKLRRIITGNPTVIIKDGKLNFNEMAKLRYSLDDLLSQLREQRIQSIEEENNGKLSVFDKKAFYPLPLILDGQIDYNVLKEINRDIIWLNNILKKRNIPLKDVFYAFYKENKTFIIKKSDLI